MTRHVLAAPPFRAPVAPSSIFQVAAFMTIAASVTITTTLAAFASPAQAAPATRPPAPSLTTHRDCAFTPRQAVEAAIRHQHLAPDDARALGRRLRLAALLPRLSARASGLHGQGLRYDLAANGPEDLGAKQSNSIGWEIRVTWNLNRLLFDGREIALLRAQREAGRARRALANATLALYFAWVDAKGRRRARLATQLGLLTGWRHSPLAADCQPVAWSREHDSGVVRGRQESPKNRSEPATASPLPHRASQRPAPWR